MSDKICDRAGLLGQDALFSLELDNWLNFVAFSIENLWLHPDAILQSRWQP
jgi:hypothetical protein